MAGHQAPGAAGGSPQHTQNPLDDTTAAPDQLAALQLLRVPFTDDEISRRPILWCSECVKAEPQACRRHERRPCEECGENVSDAHSHLRYVGHAAATARLLDVDPRWNWEPLVTTDQGLPQLDQFGGLWLRLTVCGMSRIGYGDADGKTLGTRAIKEIIGNGIRNAGMRFGMALDLWSGSRVRPVEAPEPTVEELILTRLRLPRVRESVRGLQVVRRQAEDEGVLDFVVEEADWRTIGELIGDLQSLAGQAARVAAAANRPSGGANHDTAQAAPAGAPVPVQQAVRQDLEALGRRVDAAWYDQDTLEDCLKDAETKGLLREQVPGPDNQLYPLGAFLQNRINELKRHAHTEQGQEAA